MIIHAGTTSADFVEFLYRTLQDANFSAQVMDCVERLQAHVDAEEQIARLETENESVIEERDRLREELQKLVNAVQAECESDDVCGSDNLRDALESAEGLLDEIKRSP